MIKSLVMNIGTDNYKKLAIAFLLVLITLTAGRGLFSLAPLAGHDAPAYPVNQVQFMDNLRDGVLFPRWSPDTRYGYGQPQLQFRPPLLHYLATPIHAATGNPFLALHVALIGCLFMAAWGAFSLARLRVGEGAALVAAAGFVCANYMLANLYLRGAYYEIVASAAMPWILWVQSRENVTRRRTCLIGPVAWAAMLMSHPAISFFFFPLAVAHALSETLWTRRWSILTFSFSFLVLGVLLSAPYTWVMLAERPWVRMEIFLSNLDSWRRHFFSLREWFTERWPDTYVEYNGLDYLHRALHPEMRGLNIWAVAVLLLSPLVWWLTLRHWRHDESIIPTPASGHPSNGGEQILIPSWEGQGWVGRHDILPAEKLFLAIFFYAAAWLSVTLSLRLSLPVWNHVFVMETFNYPWRVLGVTSLCLALATAYGLALISEMMERLASLSRRSGRGYRLAYVIIVALLVLAPLAEAIPHTGGWPGPAWLTRAELTPAAIHRHSGIPQQFYTPTWVQRYATEPAPTDALAWAKRSGGARQVVEGIASVTVTERHPTHWRLRVEASTPARIALSHYYYPGWRIHGPDGVITKPEPWGERALISFTVPPGTHTLEARFGSTPARRAANGGFTVGLALMLFGFLWPRRTHPPLATLRSKPSLRPSFAHRSVVLREGGSTSRVPLLGGEHKPLSLNFLSSPPSEGWLKAGVGAVFLLVGVIILTDYLVRARDDESLAVQAGQQLAEGDNLAAIHSFARLLRERETDIAARYSLGAAYHNYGWHDEALASYDNVLNLANEHAVRAAHSAARISLMRKDFERARLYYEEALRHQPNAKDIRAEYENLMLLRRKASVGKDVSFP